MMNQGVRVRCAGLLVHDGHVLMESLVGVERWCPIGGGLQPGETVPEAIIREFREEVGWEVSVGEMAVVTDDLFHSSEGRIEHAIAFFAWVDGGPEDGSIPAPRPGEEHQELAWIPLSGLDNVTLLPHHLSEDIPAALQSGKIVFRSDRRVPLV